MNSYKKKSVSGVKWTGLSTFISTCLHLIKFSVLTLFLDPKDFGLMAIVIIVSGFSQLFLDAGLSNALIYKQDVSQKQLSSIYILNILVGICIGITIISTSNLIADFYNEPELKKLILIISISFIIQPFGQQYRVILQKKLLFALLAKILIISNLLSFVLAIILAKLDFKVYALIYSNLLNVFILNTLSILNGHKYFKPSFYLSFKDIKELINFGLFQLGERIVVYFSYQIDKFIISKFLGVDVLGLYSLAWQICIFPIIKINPIIFKVAFPILSKLQDDVKRLGDYFIKAITMVMLINIPLMAGLFVMIDEIVKIFLDDKYIQVAAIIKVLCFYGIIRSFNNPGGAVFYAKGRADIGLYWNIFWFVVLSISLFLTAKYFNTLEMFTYTLVMVALSISWIWHVLIAKIGNINYRVLLSNVLRIFIISIVASSTALFTELIFDIRYDVVSLLLKSLVYLVVLFILLFQFEKEKLNTIFSMFKSDKHFD